MNMIHRAPLFRLALALITGIFLYENNLPSHLLLMAILPILLIECGVRAEKKLRYLWLISGCWYVLVAGLGGLLMFGAEASESTKPDLYPYMCAERDVIAVVDGDIRSSAYGRQVDASLIAVWSDSNWVPIQGRIRIKLPLTDSTDIHLWDSIQVFGYIRDLHVKNEGYQRYLTQQKLDHLIYSKSIEHHGHSTSLKAESQAIQYALSQQISTLVPEVSTQAIAKAMLIGDKKSLSKPMKQAFAASGLSHILAISGLHVGIVFLILNILVKPLTRFKRGAAIGQLIVLLILLAYMFITGAAPAVCRSVLMFGLMTLVKMSGKRVSILNVLGATAILQLVIQPTLVFQLGFQLSYLAVAGIVLLMPFFENLTRTHNYWLDMFYGWIAVSIAATLFTAPLTISTFGVFPTHFILANVLVSLVVFFAVLVGFVMVLCAYIPMINEWLGWLSTQTLSVLVYIAEWISQLPGAQIKAFTLKDEGLFWLVVELSLIAILMLLPRMLVSLRQIEFRTNNLLSKNRILR